MAGGLADWFKRQANAVGDGAKGGFDTIAAAAKDGWESIKKTADQAQKDGLGGTASKAWQGLGDMTKNIGMGGLFGGIFGAVIMWFFSSLFAGGMVGNIMAVAMVSAGVMIGVQQGRKFDEGKSLFASNEPPVPQGPAPHMVRGHTRGMYHVPEAPNVYFGGYHQLRFPPSRYPFVTLPPGGSFPPPPSHVRVAQPFDDLGGRGNG